MPFWLNNDFFPLSWITNQNTRVKLWLIIKLPPTSIELYFTLIVLIITLSQPDYGMDCFPLGGGIHCCPKENWEPDTADLQCVNLEWGLWLCSGKWWSSWPMSMELPHRLFHWKRYEKKTLEQWVLLLQTWLLWLFRRKCREQANLEWVWIC